MWDAKVRKISGGLTICTPVVGQWEDEDDDYKLYKERMIPVEVACTQSQFMDILTMTKVYYDQIKVYGFKLSSESWII